MPTEETPIEENDNESSTRNLIPELLNLPNMNLMYSRRKVTKKFYSHDERKSKRKQQKRSRRQNRK